VPPRRPLLLFDALLFLRAGAASVAALGADGNSRSDLLMSALGSAIGIFEVAPEVNVAWPVPVRVAELPGWLALVTPVVEPPPFLAELERPSALGYAAAVSCCAPLREADIYMLMLAALVC